MKHTRRLVLLLVFSFAFATTYAQVGNADSMIHKLFTTLKTKDEKAFVALYPNASQFGNMMRLMMEKMLNSEQMKQMMAMDEKAKNLNIDSLINAEVTKLSTPEAFAEMQKGFAQSFQRIIDKGEKKGVKWADAKLLNYTMDTTASLQGDMAMFEGSGIKTMKGIIDFRAGNTDYQMSYDKMIYLPAEGGWFGGDFPQVARKGESLEPDEPSDDEAAADTTTEPKAKAKTKTKTKTKSGETKTKTKTKSAAKKPGTKS